MDFLLKVHLNCIMCPWLSNGLCIYWGKMSTQTRAEMPRKTPVCISVDLLSGSSIDWRGWETLERALLSELFIAGVV